MFTAKKVFFAVAMVFFCMILYSFVSNVILHQSGFDKDEFLKPMAFNASHEKNRSLAYYKLEQSLRKPPVPNFDTTRNLFREMKEFTEEPLFKLLSVRREKIPIEFKGSIVRGDEVVIAQINWGNKTYFAKPGDSIKGWDILDISKEKVQIKNEKGEKTTLKVNEISFSNELVAKIYGSHNKQTYDVKVGNKIGDFRVESIQNEEVILQNSTSRLTVQK